MKKFLTGRKVEWNIGSTIFTGIVKESTEVNTSVSITAVDGSPRSGDADVETRMLKKAGRIRTQATKMVGRCYPKKSAAIHKESIDDKWERLKRMCRESDK